MSEIMHDMLSWALSYGDIQQVISLYIPKFEDAVKEGHSAIVKYMYWDAFNKKLVDDALKMLFEATKKNHPGMVKLLLDARVEYDIPQSDDGKTPLFGLL